MQVLGTIPWLPLREHGLDGPQSPSQFAGEAVQLPGNDLRRIGGDPFGEDVGPNPTGDQLPKAPGVEPGLNAAAAPLFGNECQT